jgi:phosphoglycolate phosphatase-like HAD superfamily hydrolase
MAMFDIDGTLVASYDFDTDCFQAAVREVLDLDINTDWHYYRHVSDAGILQQVFEEQGVHADRAALTEAVREAFTRRIADHLSHHPISPIPGAQDFFDSLRRRGDLDLAMATGGWRETARLKLQAAGFETDGVPLASSSDHFDRIEIMKLAERRSGYRGEGRKTYFGDGPWDHRAATALGYNFVLVGNRLEHDQAIADFRDSARALAYLGL